MPVPASFMSGLNHLGTQVVYGQHQLPDGYGVGRSPPAQRLETRAREAYDAQEAAARASAYAYDAYGSQRPASHRGPAPPKAMQSIVDGLDKELHFQDPQVKELLHEIFQIPAFTQQLFSFPVHCRFLRRTYFGHPCNLLPDMARGIIENARNPGAGNPYKDVFDLPPSNEPERVGYRINQAIDLYKDAWCYNREHQSVPVLAETEAACKAKVDAWVQEKKRALAAPPVPQQPPGFQAPQAEKAPRPVQAPAYQTTPQQTVVTPAVEASPAKPVSHAPYGMQFFPQTSSATNTYRGGAGVPIASIGAGPSSVVSEMDVAAAAAKAELERSAAANQSAAKMHAAVAENQLRAAAAIGVSTSF